MVAFSISPKIYIEKVQKEGLVVNYLKDKEFALRIKMLASLAFVPEMDVIDSFNILMQNFPESAMNIGKYFEEYYIGRNYLTKLEGIPLKLWYIFSRVITNQARNSNSFEG